MTAAAQPADALTATSHVNFADRLHSAIARAGTPACIGLDPVAEKLPASIRKQHPSAADQIQAFCLGVIDAIADTVAVVKPQSACFERYGQSGLGALRRVIQAARARGLIVILDAKRGDIGTTAEHYAAAVFGPRPTAPVAERPTFAVDALTVNGYMGMDTVEPYLTHAGESGSTNGVFVLVRTSNPGSDALQSQKLHDGRTVAEMIADHVAELGRADGRGGACGLSCVGAVVGATKSAEAAALRARMPDQYFLVPGYGAQGGTLDDIRPMLRRSAAGSPADAGIVVNASRSVIYAFEPNAMDWTDQVRKAAVRFADELRTL